MASHDFDVLIVGSGLAGLSTALHLAATHRVAVITKRELQDGSSGWAQGGIAAVLADDDSFAAHIQDTLVAGAGLAAAGAAMQSILRNPLGSPFTLGLTQAGAFGAAFAVMILGTGTMQSTQVGAITIANPYVTTLAAFGACLATSLIIIAIAKMRVASPETLVLSGVALGSLFSAGTMFLQYFADDVQLAAIVFWSFGDVGRAGWREVGLMTAAVGLPTLRLVRVRIGPWSLEGLAPGAWREVPTTLA